LLEQADIINRAQEAIIIRNLEDDGIGFWNDGAERLYGWGAEEALGKPSAN
jgi:two-component system cell cycle sensor histidine kinase/response regulator CckA